MALRKLVATARRFTEKFSIRLIVTLVGARAVYRVSMLAASIILLTTWGEDTFSGYAIAIGSFGALSFITTLGVEKCALKLIPRAKYTTRQLTTLFVLLPTGISSACLLWVLWYGSTSEHPALMMLAGTLAICGGLNQVLVGLHRVHGRPYRDMVNYLLLFVSVVVAVAGALLWELGPVGVMSIMVGAVVIANVILVPTLPMARPGTIRKGLMWNSVRTSALMSADEIAGSVIISLGFILIGLSEFRSQAAYMYVVLEGSTFMMAGFGYVLRILQPQISLYMRRGESAELMFSKARHWLRMIVLAGPPYLILVTVGALLWEHVSGRPAGALLIFLLYASSVPFFLAIGTVNYLLENHTNTSFVSTAIGSMSGMVGAGAMSLLLVPLTGAVGAMITWALADIVHAATVLLIFRLRAVDSSAGQAPAPLTSVNR
ncbi:hypothetical protein FB566_1240 [Stackebrandtia endophytica]|uniref:O-antigen/teichoic acid export membrane protein n=1 Tax=Stackebrandtia endophytica TaxID=1496996 RepID=A0A543AT41_9ACTN|nr:hypothetical protein [Stackebrandtia endophytica]TQL75728.1 hypothetical protein FB566_1240 [Stackebrandtia endophytica]